MFSESGIHVLLLVPTPPTLPQTLIRPLPSTFADPPDFLRRLTIEPPLSFYDFIRPLLFFRFFSNSLLPLLGLHFFCFIVPFHLCELGLFIGLVSILFFFFFVLESELWTP